MQCAIEQVNFHGTCLRGTFNYRAIARKIGFAAKDAADGATTKKRPPNLITSFERVFQCRQWRLTRLVRKLCFSIILRKHINFIHLDSKIHSHCGANVDVHQPKKVLWWRCAFCEYDDATLIYNPSHRYMKNVRERRNVQYTSSGRSTRQINKIVGLKLLF